MLSKQKYQNIFCYIKKNNNLKEEKIFYISYDFAILFNTYIYLIEYILYIM